MSETLFKYLNAGGVSTHVPTFRWPLPRKDRGRWVAGDPVKVAGKLVPCENGLHLCRVQDLLEWRGDALYVAQYRGERVNATDKIVVREARLIAQVETAADRMWRHFACDCAEHTLALFEKQQPSDARPREAIRIARLYAEGLASDKERDAAWAAAGAAARDAAWAAARDAARDAAWAAAGAAAWAAAWAAARDAAWAAAGDAARAAAWAAAGDAAWDAAWAAARDAAWAAAGDAARDAARAAAGDAAWAAARDAAWDAARAAERQWQTTRLLEYLRGERP